MQFFLFYACLMSRLGPRSFGTGDLVTIQLLQIFAADSNSGRNEINFVFIDC